MSKNNIDNIIADKLEGVNFEFKDEYWNSMQDKLDANCAQTNTCSSSGVSGFLVGGIAAAFIATIIGVIMFFSWGTDDNQKEVVCNADTLKEEIAITSNDSNSESVRVVMKKDEVTISQDSKRIEKSSKNLNKPKKKTFKKKAMSSKNIKQEQAIPSKVDIMQAEDEKVISDLPNTDSLVVDQIIEVTTDSLNEKHIDTIEPIVKETVTYETDSINIPDGKILGNSKEKEAKNPQLEVTKGLKPVKNVKTKSKPIKRVFGKRRGILYKLGIRK